MDVVEDQPRISCIIRTAQEKISARPDPANCV